MGISLRITVLTSLNITLLEKKQPYKTCFFFFKALLSYKDAFHIIPLSFSPEKKEKQYLLSEGSKGTARY